MTLKKVITFYLMLLFTVNFSYAKEDNTLRNTTNTWGFYDVSKKRLFSSDNENIRKKLSDTYSEIKISLSKNHLSVSGFCSAESVRLKKTISSLLYSKSTVELYRKILSSEHILLPDEIFYIAALYPQDDCPVPFNEMYELHDSLIVATTDGYLLIFKKNNDSEKKPKK